MRTYYMVIYETEDELSQPVEQVRYEGPSLRQARKELKNAPGPNVRLFRVEEIERIDYRQGG